MTKFKQHTSGAAVSSLAAADITLLQSGLQGDPFAVLGPHDTPQGRVVRVFMPGAASVTLVDGSIERPMAEHAHGLFECAVASDDYRLRIRWAEAEIVIEDPYRFPVVLTDFDLHLIAEGRFLDLPIKLGSNVRSFHGSEGVTFAVWAPNARRVAIVGTFNTWDSRRHPMRLRPEAGVWELFIPGLQAGEIYKYAIVGADGEVLPWKADPMARQAELPPRTGSIVAPPSDFVWSDDIWMAGRKSSHAIEAPISIYEVHVESWLRLQDGQAASWEAATERLIPYVVGLGFTHLELLPIAEYPFGGSWGYQPLSLFAPTSRLGDPAAFAHFVNRCHEAGLGVIIDWVPAHFPADAHGLVRFDGSALYEHSDPREGFHNDWNTMIYNVGRAEVRGFLISSAIWWMETFHIDGLRVDAVASMLYRDYSRPADAWVPNHLGGRENFEAIHFLQELNATVAARCPDVMVIAEESTAWPGVTSKDGLGFDFKWSMGWMHDTLRYFGRDPVHRGYHRDDIAFGLHYGFSEAFVLPLSHDEVVHGKGSLLSRMPGDDWQRFANLRLLFALMWTHPGKKLLFMGGEFGAEDEWKVDAPFPWPHHDDAERQGLMRLVGDLNALYRTYPPLHRRDRHADGFSWIVMDDAVNAVLAFRRTADPANPDADMVVVLNTTPVPRHEYRIGVAQAGRWTEVFNSDSGRYAGSNMGNLGGVEAESIGAQGAAFSLRLTLPPLGAIVLAPPGRPHGGS